MHIFIAEDNKINPHAIAHGYHDVHDNLTHKLTVYHGSHWALRVGPPGMFVMW
jgi:hypothetical protein